MYCVSTRIVHISIKSLYLNYISIILIQYAAYAGYWLLDPTNWESQWEYRKQTLQRFEFWVRNQLIGFQLQCNDAIIPISNRFISNDEWFLLLPLLLQQQSMKCTLLEGIISDNMKWEIKWKLKLETENSTWFQFIMILDGAFGAAVAYCITVEAQVNAFSFFITIIMHCSCWAGNSAIGKLSCKQLSAFNA